MPIVSSVLTTEAAQADGRRWLTEDHTDQLGQVYRFGYLAAAGLDGNVVMAARAVDLAAQLTANEIAANVASVMSAGSLATVRTDYSTNAANLSALRAAYQTATQLQAVMIGDFLSSLTSGQLQAIFGMTAGQVTTLRTNRLTPAHDTAAAIRATAGQ